MIVETRRFDELSTDDLRGWRNAVHALEPFGSPFFNPVYTQLLSEVRPQVRVAVVREGGVAIAWLPFEQHAGRVGKPLGIKLADFQGAVVQPGQSVSLPQIIRQAGLKAFDFDHLLAEQVTAEESSLVCASPYMDMSNGYEAYLRKQRQIHTTLIGQTEKKRRKLERQPGRMEFRWHDDDPAALELLYEWKGAQRRATGTFDVLRIGWVRQFLSQLALTNTDGFRGCVSTLRIDGELAAVHFGIHTPTTCHYWFPGYSPSHSAHSPGLILLLMVAEEAARRGMQRVDLGKGDDTYKQAFANGVRSVAVGTLDNSPFRRVLRLTASNVQALIKHSALRRAVKLPVRWWKRWQTQQAMEFT